MSAPYTVHVGPRAEAWPPQVATAGTREEARRVVSERLKAAPRDSKGEVRQCVLLLDLYGQRGDRSVRIVYSARQRGASS